MTREEVDRSLNIRAALDSDEILQKIGALEGNQIVILAEEGPAILAKVAEGLSSSCWDMEKVNSRRSSLMEGC